MSDPRREAAIQAVMDQMADGPLAWPRSVPQLHLVLNAAFDAIDATPDPVCPECNGDGEIQHLQAWDIPGATQTCPTCKGTGSTPGPTDGLRETATVALEAALDKYGYLEQADGERRRYTIWEEFLPRMGLLIARAITAANPPATPGPVAAVSEAESWAPHEYHTLAGDPTHEFRCPECQFCGTGTEDESRQIKYCGVCASDSGDDVRIDWRPRSGFTAARTTASAEPTEAVLHGIATERQRQNEKWGVQRHGWGDWIAILGEEFGEASKAAVEITFGYPTTLAEFRSELIHVAAVATQIAEHIDEIAARNAGQGVTE